MKQKLDKDDISNNILPEGWLDWNKLTLDQMVEYLRQKYMFSSSGDAKCINHLIEFYEKNHLLPLSFENINKGDNVILKPISKEYSFKVKVLNVTFDKKAIETWNEFESRFFNN